MLRNERMIFTFHAIVNSYGEDSKILGFHCVGRGADEGLDFQILLERLEEQFDLPAILEDQGDGSGAKAEMVGEEHEDVARVLANSLNAAQEMGALLLSTRAGKADDLILENIAVLRRDAFLDHLE